MKYYIIAGEPSGDLHGSNLMRAILDKDPNAQFQYWGGDHMRSVADGMVTHIRETSIMGFVEVAKNIFHIRRLFQKAKKSIADFVPDKVIFIDYPGFNLRMAEWTHANGYHNTYYISPQLWAWKKGRIKKVQSYIDDMICILPFEKDFYSAHKVEAHYVGHPLLPVISDFSVRSSFRSEYNITSKKILAILPGSRTQEISKLLPIYLSVTPYYQEEYHVVIAGAPNIGSSYYQVYTEKYGDAVTLISNDTYNLLSVADLAIVTSGTATLETALFKVPQVICYKTSSINYAIGKQLVDLKYISLVNLILDEEVVTELIQHDVNTNEIDQAIQQTIKSESRIQAQYDGLAQALTLSAGENASTEAANIITSAIK